MRHSIVTASLVAGLVLAACSPDVISATQFRIVGVVTTKLGIDSTTCTIHWATQVNDPSRPYIFEVAFAGDTGTAPDTGSMVVSDSAAATGSAFVEGDFRKPKFTIGWTFFWDTLSAKDSAHVQACTVS